MSERRLIIRMIVFLGLSTALLGLLLPTPVAALTANSVIITSIDPVFCTPYLQYVRTPTVNDGNSGFDYYRITIVDNAGQVDSSTDHHALFTSGTVSIGPISLALATLPAKTATSLTAYIYDQTTANPADPNGTLIAQSAAFSPLPLSCGTTGPVAGAAAVPSITFYPPNNRTLAYIRVDTPIYATPSTNSQIVGTLKAGQTWFVSTRDATGNFWQVFIGGPNLGWVKASDLVVSGQASAANGSGSGATSANRPGIQTVPKGTVVGIIDTAHLRIHATASNKGSPTGTANVGERYILVGRLAGQLWVKITGPAGTGWVNSFYLILSAPLSQVPVITG